MLNEKVQGDVLLRIMRRRTTMEALLSLLLFLLGSSAAARRGKETIRSVAKLSELLACKEKKEGRKFTCGP